MENRYFPSYLFIFPECPLERRGESSEEFKRIFLALPVAVHAF